MRTSKRSAYRRRMEELRREAGRNLRILPAAITARSLRNGCTYLLDGGGKHIRSTIVVLSCQAVGGKGADAADAAAAVEILHNFTLVHDDIMDNADARRGRRTVHTKWDVNLALLVGDVLVGSAYERLLKGARGHHRELAAVFTQGLIDVCDGQALDLENERRKDVTVAQYFRMIEKKTGALLGMSAELGGIIGGGTPRQQRALRVFGRCLGRAFQLQDDLLDVVADPADFGKTIGGDIIGRKKTFLLLTAVRKAAGGDRRLLESVLRKGNSSRPWRKRTGALTGAAREIVAEVAALYEKCGALDDARRLIRRNTDEALRSLSRLPDTVARSMLVQLAEDLTTRVS